MIEIFRKKHGLLVREIWFSPEVVPSDVKRDIDYYVQCSTPIKGSKPFKTLTIDLSQDEDILFKGINRKHRQHVQQAINTYGLVADVDFTPTSEAIEIFVAFFNDFAAFKGFATTNVMNKLKIMASSNNLYIVSVRRNNENVLAMSSFVSDGYRVRDQLSATLPRIGDDDILIGRANKLLHWQAMLAMKKAGLKLYDFGGISDRPELEGINTFKRRFGGIEREDYNAIQGISGLGRLALKTENLLSRFTNAENS
jgi:hypothetical protein